MGEGFGGEEIAKVARDNEWIMVIFSIGYDLASGVTKWRSLVEGSSKFSKSQSLGTGCCNLPAVSAGSDLEQLK
jgi:hypothetical protein